jgi:phosphomannomutase
MSWSDRKHPDTLCLFDVDGTLTPARQFMSPQIMATLKDLKKQCVIGFVGGSDLCKQEEQLGQDGVIFSIWCRMICY